MGEKSNSVLLATGVVAGAALISGALIYGDPDKARTAEATPDSYEAIAKAVLPTEGVELPVSWGDLGNKLVEVGAIDEEKFRQLYITRGHLSPEQELLLSGDSKENLRINSDNSGYLLNLFWALGLANKNPILETGEMMDPRYGGAGNFASTGGWSLARGQSMDHYSMHALIKLTAEQQALVDRMSQRIFRPCCGNSTHFPDCNHGMAMLALLELMASQGVSEEEMWKAALAVNSFWFPETYVTIAAYEKNLGIEWAAVDPKKVLGQEYSSASGYQNIASKVKLPGQGGGGGGCSI